MQRPSDVNRCSIDILARISKRPVRCRNDVATRIVRRRAAEEEQTRVSSASDDEVGGFPARSRSKRSEQSNVGYPASGSAFTARTGQAASSSTR